MVSIFSSDILIADVITHIDGNPVLEALVQKYDLKPGGKQAITEAQFNEFSTAVAGSSITITPGGSTANMLTTLNKLFENQLRITFLGVAGEGLSSRMIRTSMEEACITLLPKQVPSKPRTALSYVLLFENGQRTIATYSGNARDILRPEMIEDDRVKASDIVLIPGSLWVKIGANYGDRLIALAQRYQKEIWLALPTYSMTGDNHVDRFQEVIAQATLVLGNEEELARIYETSHDDALVRLQQAFQRAKDGRQHIGFITRDEQGAAIVTAQDIQAVATGKKRAPIVNTLGAGDTACAGFAYGYLKKMSPEQAATIAMTLAAEKLLINGPRLPDPLGSLKNSLPENF
jgi:sugar/nucleoside kinase (ribokinase family)